MNEKDKFLKLEQEMEIKIKELKENKEKLKENESKLK